MQSKTTKKYYFNFTIKAVTKSKKHTEKLEPKTVLGGGRGEVNGGVIWENRLEVPQKN